MTNKYATLILADLTAEDEQRFHAAQISYSGSTGQNFPNDPNGLAPYIATYLPNLQAAVVAMGWDRFRITIENDQWIVRKGLTRMSVLDMHDYVRDAVKGNSPNSMTDTQRTLWQLLVEFGNNLIWHYEKLK